jgi:hypothetical protein
MAFVRFINSKENQVLRDLFKKYFPTPEPSLFGRLRVKPLSENPQTVGNAVDYMIRFYVERLNEGRAKNGNKWIAERALNSLTARLERENVSGQNKALIKSIEFQFSKAKDNHSQFLKDGIISNKLIKSSIFLGKLDSYYRSKKIDNSLKKHSLKDIQDVKKIMAIIRPDNFTAKKKCFLNPTFGRGSEFVGGADADLIIDDTIIDIKAVKHLKIERKYLNQLIGYYILSLIGGINGKGKKKTIKNIGIYFARHGILWSIPLSTFGDISFLEKFRRRFEFYIKYSDIEYGGYSDELFEIWESVAIP